MTSCSTLQVIGRAVAASAILGAGLVFVPPAFAADDFPIVGDIHIPMPRILEDEDGPRPPPAYERPPVERPYYEERPYSQRPSAPGPYAAIPSSRYQRSTLGARPMLPPEQVVTVLRSSGYSPLGLVTQRGWIYTIAAIDRNGDDGRLIIDARTGQIMRFIPAQAVDERMMAVYGPPGPPPAIYAGYENRRGALLDLRNAPRPPAAVPRTAQRPGAKATNRTPTPSPAPAGTSTVPQTAAPAQQQAAAPSAEPSAAAKPAAVENKPAAATVGAATAPAPQAPTVRLWPTQAMPDAQTLE